MPMEEVKALVDEGASRGNNYVDQTGGEPSLYPDIEEVIRYSLTKGIKTCMITNGRINSEKTKSILDAGIDGFLVSRHGVESTFNNKITHSKDAYERQERFLQQITTCENPPELRFNCVISKFSQNELLDVSKEFSKYKPTIVNFINMNPHKDWMADTLTTQDVIADLRIAGPQLNAAIEYLESKGIGVNVRYYPMCHIAEEYRRTVCNDNSVTFDPYEWDYQIPDKDYSKFRQWGINCSANVEEKNEPCCDCDLQGVCGGANKHFHKASNACYGELLVAQKDTGVTQNDFYHYRKHNVKTLIERI
jgi:MoaA/NifB/PqqE/SkfB family radical SAM enzyme